MSSKPVAEKLLLRNVDEIRFLDNLQPSEYFISSQALARRQHFSETSTLINKVINFPVVTSMNVRHSRLLYRYLITALEFSCFGMKHCPVGFYKEFLKSAHMA